MAEPESRLPYRLGLPAWAFGGWQGRYFPTGVAPLAAYAGVFNVVEGNTSFYRVPDAATVSAWAEALAGTDCRIAFKLPREVTHERQPDHAVLERFLGRIAPLEAHLAPLLLQFPASLKPTDLDRVARLLEALPRDWRKVIEVRHREFFERRGLLEPLLERFELGRVCMDTRALYRGDRSHPEVLNALHEKPDLPILPEVVNGVAFLRLVLHPDRRDNDRYIDEWSERLAVWLDDGVDAHVLIHCPNNLHCPELAERFHASLRRRTGDVAALPAWPVPQQGSLL